MISFYAKLKTAVRRGRVAQLHVGFLNPSPDPSQPDRVVSTSFVFNPTIREGLPMATAIRYADILNYLTAIMNKETNPISGSPHGEWWSGLSYNDFVNGQVPNLGVPIMNSSNPLQSAFYVILTNTNGYQGMPQMPYGAVHHRREATARPYPTKRRSPGRRSRRTSSRGSRTDSPSSSRAPPGSPDPKEDTTRRTQHETPSACRRAGAPDPSRADRRTGPAADLQQC